jgi:hypothetical protein
VSLTNSTADIATTPYVANGVDITGEILVSGYPQQNYRHVYITSSSDVKTSFNDDDEGNVILLVIVGLVAAIALTVGFTVLVYCVWTKTKSKNAGGPTTPSLETAGVASPLKESLL